MPTFEPIVGETVDGPDRASRSYTVFDAADAAEARETVAANVPTSIGGLSKREVTSTDYGNPTMFRVTVSYSEKDETDRPEPGYQQDAFTIVPPRSRVYTALEVISSTPVAGSGDAPDHGGAINVTPDGEVMGVEWPPSGGTGFSITKEVDASVVTQSYIRAVYGVAGKVNSGAYQGFQAGELLFVGANGTRTRSAVDAPWSITYEFLVSLNELNLQVAPGITVPKKDGWHYVWHYFERGVDEAAFGTVMKPRASYVVQVARESGFGGLIA